MKKIIKLLLILVIIVGLAFALDVPTKVMKLLYPIKYENFVEENSNYQQGDSYNYWSEKKGSKFKKVRDIEMPSQCSNCDRLCKYECLGTRYEFNKSFNKSDPNCLRKVMTKCKKIK